jgi:tRNA threonylcarbamoyladenosine biosynthesis protein TsaB
MGGIEGIAVSQGPGSYTGLRIGIGTAKGLAIARDLPIAGLSSLEVVAANFCRVPHPVWCVLPSRRGYVYAACFNCSGMRPVRVAEDAMYAIEEFVAGVSEPSLLCGPGAEIEDGILSEALGERYLGVPEHVSCPRGEVVASLGRERLAAGEGVSAAAVVPVYIGKPPIRLSRRPGKGG